MNEKVKWLVVGIGDITTKRVLPAIQAHAGSELHGIVTRSPDKAAPYSCSVYPSLDVALRDSGAQAVYVATPVALHVPQTIAALRAGRHVLCEKPLGINYAEAKEAVDAAKSEKRLFGVSYYRRFYPKLQKAKQLIAAGAIGQPVLCEANCHGWFAAEGGHRAWLLDPQMAGGGPLYDIASHRIDAMNYLFGDPARACGFLSNAVHRYAVEDNASVLIEYASGPRGYVDVRWHSRADRDQFRIIGTDGEIQLSSLNGPVIEWPGGREELPAHPNLHYPLVANFAESILTHTPLLSSGETALWTDWVTEQLSLRLS